MYDCERDRRERGTGGLRVRGDEDRPDPRQGACLPVPRLHRSPLARADDRPLLHVAARAVGDRSTGWWDVITQPSLATRRQLPRDLRQRRDHVGDLDDALDLARRDDPPDRDRLPRGVRVRLARVPRARLAVPRRRRAARRPDPDGADPDLLPLQRPRPVRHDPRARALPHGVRAAVRDLPAAELLHRNPTRPARGRADRRCVRAPDLPSRDPAAGPAGDRVARDLPVPLGLERPARRAHVRAATRSRSPSRSSPRCGSSARTSSSSRPRRSSRSRSRSRSSSRSSGTSCRACSPAR